MRIFIKVNGISYWWYSVCVGRNDFFFNGLRRYAGLVRMAVVVGGFFNLWRGFIADRALWTSWMLMLLVCSILITECRLIDCFDWMHTLWISDWFAKCEERCCFYFVHVQLQANWSSGRKCSLRESKPRNPKTSYRPCHTLMVCVRGFTTCVTDIGQFQVTPLLHNLRIQLFKREHFNLTQTASYQIL